MIDCLVLMECGGILIVFICVLNGLWFWLLVCGVGMILFNNYLMIVYYSENRLFVIM